MSILDTYYRAFKEYRKQTADDTGCEKDRRAVAESNVEEDSLKATKYLCKIENDWVKAIEEGLTYVGKAVEEERQFIRTNGEVVPIEKVKKVSKDSVEHLARHSDMITHVPEDETESPVPDKLLMVEKLSDYAVYENRFLYMMLCYVRSFIEFRLEKIEKLRHTYVGEMSINKSVEEKYRTLKIRTEIHEERTDNPFPVPDESSANLVQRIKDCQSIINSLLSTDLMLQVAETPMIKPPIVKTNVLKMNNNFKRALALYDYIASYKGLGYEYEEVTFDFAPFTDAVADEIAEAANLTSFLSYKVGNGIENILEAGYEAEELRRREEEAKRMAERLKRLKKHALESNQSLEEYMLVLEERNRRLEKEAEEILELRKEIEYLNAQIEEVVREKEELTRRAEELSEALKEKERELEELKARYLDDIAALKTEHSQNIKELEEAQEEEIRILKAEFADTLTETSDEYEAQIAELTGMVGELNSQIAAVEDEYAEKSAELNERLANLDADRQLLLDDCSAKIKDAETRFESDVKELEAKQKSELKKVREEAALIRGELDGIRAKAGKLTPSADYASRERFLELEEAYLAYHTFFKSQWEITKKEIRKTVLWTKRDKDAKRKN